MLRVDVVKKSITAFSSNEGEFETSTTVAAPSRTSASPFPVSVLTPVSGEAGTASWPCSRSLLTSFEPISPVPPMITSLMTASLLCPAPKPASGAAELRQRRSLDRRHHRRALVLHQEHQESGRRRRARVSANGVHVVRSLVEGLAGHQRDRS